MFSANEFYNLVIVVLIILLLLTGIFAIVLYNQLPEEIEDLSFDNQVTRLSRDYECYKNITRRELLGRWIDLFLDFRYRMKGDIALKATDCSRASWMCLRSFGYPGRLRSVRQTVRLLEKLDIGRGSPHTGAIMIINMKKRIPHMGIVLQVTPKGLVQYLDVNSVSGTMSLQELHPRNIKIYGIYPMKYSFWTYDIFKSK